jgi:hypothetical protein
VAAAPTGFDDIASYTEPIRSTAGSEADSELQEMELDARVGLLDAGVGEG